MGTTDECKASLVGKNEEKKKACVPLLESKNIDRFHRFEFSISI
jgi:hypothetical protein